jgi:hypothetical protein
MQTFLALSLVADLCVLCACGLIVLQISSFLCATSVSPCLGGVVLLGIHQPPRHRGHRGCTEKRHAVVTAVWMGNGLPSMSSGIGTFAACSTVGAMS